MWKAIILIGGPDKGTRFRPLSLDIPKPLFPVAGLPMVQHHIEACCQVPEIKEILLIGFFPLSDELKNFLAYAKKAFTPSIRYLQEYTSLGTGGGLYHFRDQISAGSPSAFLVFNVDVCCNFPLQDILHFHSSKTADDGITIVATEVMYCLSIFRIGYTCLSLEMENNRGKYLVCRLRKDTTNSLKWLSFNFALKLNYKYNLVMQATHQESMSYGCLVEDKKTGEATHYVEKPETFVSSLINCGVYVFSQKVLQYMENVFKEHQSERFDISKVFALNNSVETMAVTAASQNEFLWKKIFCIHMQDPVKCSFTKQRRCGVKSNLLRLPYMQTSSTSLSTTKPILVDLPWVVTNKPQLLLVGIKKDNFAILKTYIEKKHILKQCDVFIHKNAEVHSTAVIGPNVTIDERVVIGPGVRVSNSIVLPGAVLKDHSCVLNSIIGWESTVGQWSRVEGTAHQPDPNTQFSKIVSGGLFNEDGRLCPSITVLGRQVTVAPEIVVLNSIVLPNKAIQSSSKNLIIL
uniref:Nucleotidyl transferase domain-containing protein n=1 Tax=Ciona savignyi TaxID=51511 RepID=H2Y8P6_CIOSA